MNCQHLSGNEMYTFETVNEMSKFEYKRIVNICVQMKCQRLSTN